MTIQEMIFHRKSVRSYESVPVDLPTVRKIESFTAGARPLYPEIRVRCEIVGRERIKCILPWLPPQAIAIYSEDAPGAPENAGFIFQQVELYIQSLGLGACWLGLGRLDTIKQVRTADGLRCIMLIAFGHPKGNALRSNPEEFRRKSLAEIADRADEALEPARLAPSSVNSQPWYFTHEGETVHVYCVRRGLIGAKTLGEMNRMDVGIALAHICVSNPETFRFFHTDNAADVKGYGYIGSFSLQ